jgi:hypothetical protein
MNIPCEECLTLALCRHKKEVVCEALFKWLRANKNPTLLKPHTESIDKCFPYTKLFGLSWFVKHQVTLYERNKKDNE